VRGPLETQGVTHSLGEGLAPSFMEDPFVGELVAAFDQVLAPVFLTLDNLDAYLAPLAAPDDFLPWLAGWLGVAVDERWSQERRRRVVARAHEVYRWRGTRRGIAEAVRAYTDVECEIEENGALEWSPVPGGRPPGEPVAGLLVRVRSGDEQVDQSALARIVAEAAPVHVPCRVELLR